MNITFLGEEACALCNSYNRDILLTGTVIPDGQGGRWWECAAGQCCPACKEPLTRLHQPSANPDWSFDIGFNDHGLVTVEAYASAIFDRRIMALSRSSLLALRDAIDAALRRYPPPERGEAT